MTTDTSSNLAFAEFAAFYARNRNRFEFHMRKRFDEMAARETAPQKFQFYVERKIAPIPQDSYDAVRIEYEDRRFKRSEEFPLDFFSRFRVSGGAAATVLIQVIIPALEESYPFIAEALAAMRRLRDDQTDLRLVYYISPEGSLTYVKATRGEGAMTIKSELFGIDDFNKRLEAEMMS